MKKLNAAVERFVWEHPNFGISNLMRVVVIGQVIVYCLAMFSDYAAVSFLTFNLSGLLKGEVWRLVTWIFMPENSRPVMFLISLLCYYSIGISLERSWGTAKFNLYYYCGMAASVLAAVLASLISGHWGWSLSGGYYLHMTLFLALAVMHPDATINLWVMIFPLRLKTKWLAWFYAALLAINLIRAIGSMNLVGIMLPIVSMLNFLVFFWPETMYFLGFQTARMRHQTSAQTVRFKSVVHKQNQQTAAQGFRHRCTVCGRTDVTHPNLEFRYCSRCAGYHCFCEDHIFNHEHFTE